MAKNLTWTTVNLDASSEEVRKAWTEFRKARDKAQTTFENAFEKALENAKKLPAGKRVVFSYKWDKLSIAFDDVSTRADGGSITV